MRLQAWPERLLLARKQPNRSPHLNDRFHDPKADIQVFDPERPIRVERVHRIALVVGTMLNLINRGPRWFHGDELLLGYCLLNYMAPYCVAAYSAVRTRLQDFSSADTLEDD